MNKEKRRVPKLRFPGFTEDWEQRKLESLFTKYEDKVKTPNSGYWRLGLRSHCKGTFHTYVDAGNELETAEMNRVQSGNFILNITFAWERALAVTNEEDQDKLVSHRFPQFKPNSDLAIDFFKHTLMDKRFKHHLELSSPGGAGRNKVLKIADMLKYELLVPSIKEQNEISSFLNNVDYIITLHQRKLEHLNLKKKALLQKLFPKNGERYPELRFPGFTDAWEQRKLGDFTNQINTFVNPEDAKLPLWSLTAEAGLIEKSDRYERDFLVKKKDQFKRIETNTLVYNPMNITIGSIDIYTGLYPIAVSGYYVSIVYNKNIDTDFLKEVLLLPSSLKMYKNYATGSLIERQRVQYPTFSKLQLLLPNLDEQKAIGQLFKSLNLNITLHQRKLEHLQLQKKALLQQMFV